jgi:hypothetical protein
MTQSIERLGKTGVWYLSTDRHNGHIRHQNGGSREAKTKEATRKTKKTTSDKRISMLSEDRGSNKEETVRKRNGKILFYQRGK